MGGAGRMMVAESPADRIQEESGNHGPPPLKPCNWYNRPGVAGQLKRTRSPLMGIGSPNSR